MNRQKKLLLLLSLLILVSAAALVVVKGEEKKEKIKNTPATILEWSDIDSVSWDYDGTSLAFQKEDGSWVYPADTAFPVDQEKMEDLLAQFQDLGAAFTIEEVEDYGQYGLEKPLCTITLTQGEETKTLTLGNYSQMDSQRYASLGDGNVYLLSHDPLDEFDATLSDFIQQDTVPDFGTVTEITVSGTESDSFVRQEDRESLCAEDVYFRASDNGALDTDLVESWLRSLKNTKLTDYVTYNATEAELADCLLDAPQLTVTISYVPEEDGETEIFTLHLSKEADASEDEPGQAYARVGDSPILYRIGNTTYETLTACDYDDLRHQQVFTGDFDQVVRIDATLEGETQTFVYETREDEDAAWYFGDTTLDLTELQTALENLTADSFTTASPTGKQELALKLTLEDGREVTISLYRLDGTQSLAQVDGKSLCYLPRSQAVALLEAVQTIVLG